MPLAASRTARSRGSASLSRCSARRSSSRSSPSARTTPESLAAIAVAFCVTAAAPPLALAAAVARQEGAALHHPPHAFIEARQGAFQRPPPQAVLMVAMPPVLPLRL